MNNVATFPAWFDEATDEANNELIAGVDKRFYRNQQTVSFDDYKRRINPQYECAPFHKLLADKLQQVEAYIRTGGAEGINRLMVFMPPRHTKTTNVSRLFPGWFIGRNPDKRVMMASYGATLAQRNSRFVRNTIKSNLFAEMFPGVRLSPDTASVAEWDIADHEGGCISAGVGGGFTGHGAHLLIVDDPIKSRAEAESETYREGLKEWYGDAYTRLEEPGNAIIIMHTRWHEDDLAGWLLTEHAEQWVVLRLPAFAETQEERDAFAKKYKLPVGEPEPLGREPGEALWPAKYGKPELDDRAEKLGEYRFGSEYQQNPQPKSGGLFDAHLIKVIDLAPECVDMVRFYDLAVTEKLKADYTVGLKLGVTRAEEFVILDVTRVQKELPDVQEIIVQNATVDGPKTRIRLEAEKAGLVQLQYLLRDTRMRPYTIDGKPPLGDKYVRAGPVAVRVKAGRVSMVKAEWNRAFLDELAMFNNGKHDDQVDALSGAYDMFVNKRELKSTTGYWA